jgi:hypothetical protein
VGENRFPPRNRHGAHATRNRGSALTLLRRIVGALGALAVFTMAVLGSGSGPAEAAALNNVITGITVLDPANKVAYDTTLAQFGATFTIPANAKKNDTFTLEMPIDPAPYLSSNTT